MTAVFCVAFTVYWVSKTTLSQHPFSQLLPTSPNISKIFHLCQPLNTIHTFSVLLLLSTMAVTEAELNHLLSVVQQFQQENGWMPARHFAELAATRGSKRNRDGAREVLRTMAVLSESEFTQFRDFIGSKGVQDRVFDGSPFNEPANYCIKGTYRINMRHLPALTILQCSEDIERWTPR
jgi:hypothetical protein